MWTITDKRFLKRIGIEADDPPAPLPRFSAVAAAGGDYEVVDRVLKFRAVIVFAAHPLARAFAEIQAQELNEKHESKT